MTPTDTPVARLVHGSPVTVGMDDLAVVVHEAMRKRRRRFAAVVQGGSVTAVLDRAKLANRLASAPGKEETKLRVRDVVHPGMTCLPGSATVDAANRLLRATRSAAVPVLDEHHRLLGLITAEQVNRELRRHAHA